MGSAIGCGETARSAGKDHPPTKTTGCAWGGFSNSFVVVVVVAAAVSGTSGFLGIASGLGVGIGSVKRFFPQAKGFTSPPLCA